MELPRANAVSWHKRLKRLGIPLRFLSCLRGQEKAVFMTPCPAAEDFGPSVHPCEVASAGHDDPSSLGALTCITFVTAMRGLEDAAFEGLLNLRPIAREVRHGHAGRLVGPR